MANPSVFSIPGLFRLNLVIVELPTDRYVTSDRGGREYLTRKVAFYLQLDVVSQRSPKSSSDGSIRNTETPLEGYLVPDCSINIDGVETWTKNHFPPELKPGTKISCTVNGSEGTLTIEELVQDSFLPPTQAGFGDRIICSFTQRSRGNDGF